MSILVTLCKLIFTVLLGFYFSKKGVINENVSVSLSRLVLEVTAPLLMLVSVTYVEPGQEKAVFMLLVAGVITYILLPFIGGGIARLIRAPKENIGVFTCMIVFVNSGFLGYPVVQALYGDSAIFYDAMYHFPFNFFFYTLGLHLIAKDAGKVSKFEIKEVFNAGSICSVLAAVFYFTNFHVPDLLMEPFTFIGNLTSPLSLLVIGANIARYSAKDLFGNKKIYWIGLFRLLIMPVLTAVCLYGVFANKVLVAICAMTMGMPVGASVAMAGCQYELTKDVSNISVAFTTLCFFITMPVMALFFHLWLGV